MPFEILPHTADIRLRATGSSLAELFQGALEGMAAVQVTGDKRQETSDTRQVTGDKRQVKIHLTAHDAAALLVDFLSEVLVLSQEHHAVFRDAEFSKLTETELAAVVKGAPVEEFREDIKAVTYHEAEVRQVNGSWEAHVIFDI